MSPSKWGCWMVGRAENIFDPNKSHFCFKRPLLGRFFPRSTFGIRKMLRILPFLFKIEWRELGRLSGGSFPYQLIFLTPFLGSAFLSPERRCPVFLALPKRADTGYHGRLLEKSLFGWSRFKLCVLLLRCSVDYRCWPFA